MPDHPQQTPVILFDHVENVASLTSPDAALRKINEPRPAADRPAAPSSSQKS